MARLTEADKKHVQEKEHLISFMLLLDSMQHIKRARIRCNKLLLPEKQGNVSVLKGKDGKDNISAKHANTVAAKPNHKRQVGYTNVAKRYERHTCSNW